VQTREKDTSAVYGEILADIKILTSFKIIIVLQRNKCHNIVTVLTNAMQVNSSASTVQHATIEEAVSAVTSRSGGWWSRDMFPVMRVRSSTI
jgi:hypothetical protein